MLKEVKILSFCSSQETLNSIQWFSCYLTTGKHFEIYKALFVVISLLLVTAPLALLFGFLGAVAARSRILLLSSFGKLYIAIVRGIPDIAFFMFFVIALDQFIEWIRHKLLCPNWDEPIRKGSDFVVCKIAKMPLNEAPQWIHDTYAFLIAVFTFSIVFGAFAANVLFGAMKAVPKSQVETAEAFGMGPRQCFWKIIVPQMWLFAIPGLGNLWMILIKATPLLFLLGIEDIVYWARELGGTKTSKFTNYPHGDWRMWYFLALLIFYLCCTKISELFLNALMEKLTFGQGNLGEDIKKNNKA